ncbi:MAG: hypothetical protein A2Y33_10430 [Spirochaetes bacterium GWF1_51_8]|nr:MAG: hypothetical protein A2Y33_10430 [Spirochaetes bacterium GWF1_51_8]
MRRKGVFLSFYSAILALIVSCSITPGNNGNPGNNPIPNYIPVITVASPSNNTVTTNGAVTIVGSASVSSPVTILNVKVKLNSGEWQNASGTSVWGISIGLPAGTNTISVMAVSSLSFTNYLSNHTIIFENNSPVPFVAILSPANGAWITNGNVWISGTASVGLPAEIQTARISLNGGIWKEAEGTESWSNEVSLNLGSNTISVLAVSTKGKTNIISGYSIIYYPVPSVYISSPVSGTVAVASSLTVHGGADIAEPSSIQTVKIKVNNTPWENVFGTKSWYANIALWCGTNRISVMAVSAEFKTNIVSNHIVILNTVNPMVTPCFPFKDNFIITSNHSVFWGYATSSSTITNIKVSINGKAFSNASVTNIGGMTRWNTKDLKLTNGVAGVNTLKVYGKDNSGKTSITNTYLIIVKNKLVPADGGAGDYFGKSTDISGDGKIIIIGSPNDDDIATDSGAVYVYRDIGEGNGWIIDKLIPSYDTNYLHFGHQIAISGDGNTIVVGTFRENDSSYSIWDFSNFGAYYYFYVYKWDGLSWNEAYVETYYRGISGLDINWEGNRIILSRGIQSRLSEDPVYFVSIYDYTENLWTNTFECGIDGYRLDPEFWGAGSMQGFGYSVSLSSNGNNIVVGSPAANPIAPYTYAFLYQWNGSAWIEDYIKKDSFGGESSANYKFGNCVSISGDGNRYIVGSPIDNNKKGCFYEYKWNGVSWDELKISASDGVNGDYFGYSAATTHDGNKVVVGAPGYLNAQASYIYYYTWNGSAWVQSKTNASDRTATDGYGFSVGISANGGKTVVGAPCDDDKGTDSGSVWVY